ncbi:MAG: hypothetical protein ACRD8U_13810 [Pyrinomonadaceae bacterium]
MSKSRLHILTIAFLLGQLAVPAQAQSAQYTVTDQVVGHVFICDLVGDICNNGRTRAFIFDRGTRTVLGTLGGRDSLAFGINNSGQIWWK